MAALLLPSVPEEFLQTHTSGYEIITGLGGYPYTKDIIDAGHEHNRLALLYAKGRPERAEDSDDENDKDKSTNEDSNDASDNAAAEVDVSKLDEKKFLKLNYYAQLGIGHLGFNASDSQIRQAYHKALIKYHPDKTGRGETDPIFLSVQTAYATLGDAQKRRAYDSQCEFDDWIPTGSEKIYQNLPEGSYPSLKAAQKAVGAEDFYQLYGPVFARNARFSVTKPVPELGNDETTIDQVYAFYDFWHAFDSWRDFSHDAEHDVDSADYREEKRWMQRQNENAAKKKKKKEYQRLANLVDRALAADPRIRRAKIAEKEAKQRAKQEKRDAEERKKQALIDEEERKKKEIAEEAARKKAVAKAVRMEKDRIKRETKKCARQINELLNPLRESSASVPSEDDVTAFTLKMELSELQSRCVALSDTTVTEEDIDALCKLIENYDVDEVKTGAAPAVERVVAVASDAKKQEEQKPPQTQSWSQEEITMLTKAVVKFPGGTRNRWQQIADYITHHLSLKEPRTKEDCIAKSQTLQLAQAKQSLGKGPAPTPAASAAPAGRPGSTSAAPAAPAGATGGNSEDVWTAAQQTALEAALKLYPAYLDKNDRWRLIAETVPGKNKKQCVARFKQLREAVMAARQQKK